MENFKKKKAPNINLRFNALSILVYVMGAILVMRLFSLQIVNGATYRETSNTRLTRESILYAARGNIVDRNGSVIAGTEMTFALELYKTKLDNEVLNNSILAVINTLEENGDKYTDTFPIKINPFEFEFSNENRKKDWLKKYNLAENATPEEAFNYFKDRYDIKNESIEEIRKILTVRYRITSEGYSATKSLTISNSISRKSALIFDEQNYKYPGIDVVIRSQRSYPNGNLAAHILGYVSSIREKQYEENKDAGYTMNDLYGQNGVEYVFERYLKGKNGKKQIDMSVAGEIVNEYTEEEAISGSNIVLTIDANLQSVAEKALEETITKSEEISKDAKDADSGAIVVMNVKTGEVLAMASYPTYSPGSWNGGRIEADIWNSYNSEEANRPLINRAIASAYAPGSTYKMVTAIASLQTGNVTIKEKINDTGVYPRGHNPKCWIYDSRHIGHGYLNVTDAIKHSCNYFFFEMGYRVGIENLNKYARQFGLASKTGIELLGETTGTLASQEVTKTKGEVWTLGYTLSAAIGQGDNNFTPVQMAKYMSILVNGGKQVNPSIVKTAINSDGTEVDKAIMQEAVNKRLGISPNNNPNIDIAEENLKAIMEGMKGVTSEVGGTAYNVFRNFNIEIGGKTGSAQTGANGERTNAWFVGFAPYNNPEIAVACIVENGGTGSIACYPARDVIAQYFGMNEARNRRKYNSNTSN